MHFIFSRTHGMYNSYDCKTQSNCCKMWPMRCARQMKRHRAKKTKPPLQAAFKCTTLYERVHCRKRRGEEEKTRRNVIFVIWISVSVARENHRTSRFEHRRESRSSRETSAGIRSRGNLFSGCRYVVPRLVKISHCAKWPSRLGKITRVRLRKRAVRV